MTPHPAHGNYETYADFARAIYETGVLSDPYFDGKERFRLDGVVLSAARACALREAAERVAYLHQELVEILTVNPSFVEEFYPLTPYQNAMWEASGGLWHGMARADLFICDDGRIQCCELNSDTPSGQPEAVMLNEMLHGRHVHARGTLCNPNAGFAENFTRMLRQSHAKRTNAELRAVAIIYPTELTEDLAMITLFTRWLEGVGVKVVTGSPYNLRRTSQGIEALGVEVDLIVRHYKTDWWGERVPVWTDAPDYPDAAPLHAPLAALLGAELAGEVTVVNPFGSVVTQNKLSLAFFWEHLELFTPQAQRWICELIPETRRMNAVPREQLRNERERWVLKSDYGCEGRETVCGAFVKDDEWRKAIDNAEPAHFIAQKFFRVAPDNEGWLPNYGVYLLGGTAAGFFTRLDKQSTEFSSLTAPTFIAEEENGKPTHGEVTTSRNDINNG